MEGRIVAKNDDGSVLVIPLESEKPIQAKNDELKKTFTLVDNIKENDSNNKQ